MKSLKIPQILVNEGIFVTFIIVFIEGIFFVKTFFSCSFIHVSSIYHTYSYQAFFVSLSVEHWTHSSFPIKREEKDHIPISTRPLH